MKSNDLTQLEADALLGMAKHADAGISHKYPSFGGLLQIPLYSDDKKEDFILDIQKYSIELRKTKLQTRARKMYVLARIDMYGPGHRNPDDTDVGCPHLHLYREGFGDKWAIPLPAEFFKPGDNGEILKQFMAYCNVITEPKIELELFI